jgi:hypothetical protein
VPFDGFELRPRPSATEATALEHALACAELPGVMRPDPYTSAWRDAGMLEAVGHDVETEPNGAFSGDARGQACLPRRTRGATRA